MGGHLPSEMACDLFLREIIRKKIALKKKEIAKNGIISVSYFCIEQFI